MIFLGVFTLGFNWWGNAFGSLLARMERFGKKYKLRWITKHNPTAIAYTTALEAVWEPTKLSRPSTDLLSEAFVRLDRELLWGMSRQLVINVLKKVSKS